MGSYPNLNSQSQRYGRNRWLSGGSALAAAIAALALVPDQSLAQSIAGGTAPLPRGEVPHLRVMADDQAPAPRLPSALVLANAPAVPVTQVQAPVTSGPAVQTTGAYAITSAPLAGGITTLSSTVAPSPGDTDTAGISVLASANYFASEINYTPNAAGDVINVLASSAIINWTTNTAGTAGGQVTFLPSGNQLSFTSFLTDYTVLNRIFTPGIDAAVRIDGAVNASAISGSPGGNIWFYSPGGLIIGSNSVFNVGSLMLTSSNVNAIGAAGSAMNFTGVADPASSVVIEQGAQITANSANAYLAVVAPRVEQRGTVNVNGSVAYVGAEQAQLTIVNGLFDITVGLGSDDANGVVHTGTTTGSAAQPTVNGLGQITDADARGIYLVAVPKNTAIAMLVGGSLGYQPAVAASLAPNGSIILSAGAGITVGGSPADPAAKVDSANAVSGGSVTIADAALTSNTAIFASDSVDMTQSGAGLVVTGDARDNHDLTVTAANAITFGISELAGISVAGDLILKAGQSVDVVLASREPKIGENPPPGGGTLAVGGNFVIDTSARGADDFDTTRNNGNTGIGGDAAAGAINLNISGGSALTVAGSLIFDASAQGGKGELQNGSGTGGTIVANFGDGITAIGGALILDSSVAGAGEDKLGGNGPGLVGSDSTAGDVTLALAGGQFIANGIGIFAGANATAGSDSATPQSNDAAGGTVSIDVTGGTHLTSALLVDVQANAAASFDGAGNAVSGQAGRGSVSINLANPASLFEITNDLDIFSTTDGIVGTPSAPVVSIDVNGTGAAGGLIVGGVINIAAYSTGGSATGLTQAGSVSLTAADGQISTDGIFVQTSASASGPFATGSGLGVDFAAGDVTLRATTGGTISADDLFIDAAGFGAEVDAGEGTGGQVTIAAENGAIAIANSLFVNASGSGGAGGSAGNPASLGVGRGGSINLAVSGASGLLSMNQVNLNVDASIAGNVESMNGIALGDGGLAFAGSIIIDVLGGTFTAGTASFSTNGFGGESFGVDPATLAAPPAILFGEAPELAISGLFGTGPTAFAPPALAAGGGSGLPSAGDGGSGQGGSVTFNLNGGSASFTDVTISASGVGGSGAAGSFDDGTRGGTGGDGIGGTVVFNGTAGQLDVSGALDISANGNFQSSGGAGGFGNGTDGGNGGAGIGGTATFNFDGTAALTSGQITVSADGFGGLGGSSGAFFDATGTFREGANGGSGGAGSGGVATFNNISGSINSLLYGVSGSGIGGNGGDSFGFGSGDSTGAGGAGGAGTGGAATLNLAQDEATGPGFVSIAVGIGGTGGNGLNSGNGGDAQGGTARLIVNNSNLLIGSALVNGSAVGGNAGFVDTDGGAGGSGGNAVGGSALVDFIGSAAGITSALDITFIASADGGNGASGGAGDATVAAGLGGSGGNAIGGIARIAVTGASTSATQTFASGGFVFNADATGGNGGSGGGNFAGGVAADGGRGGDATGGSITIEAGSGTIVTLDGGGDPYVLSAVGFGGTGGAGGNIDMVNGGTAGNGGDGGNGIGGSPTLRAIGGTITGPDVQLSGFGFGGDGGAGGTDFTVALGLAGNGGNGVGGTPLLELLNGSPGIISLGNLTVDANGIAGSGTITGIDASGLVTFRDLSTEAGGVFDFGTLTVDATGFAVGPGGGGLVFIAGSGINSVAGNMQVNVTGDITYAFDGDAQIVVGGNTNLNATGNITVTHTNNAAPVNSIDTGGNFNAFAGGNFAAGAGSVIAAGGEMFIFAGGDIAADDLRAVPVIQLNAGGNVLLRNAVASGPQGISNVGGIIIDAGITNIASITVYDPNYNATITGDIQSYSDISINAGGSAIFTGTSNVAAGNRLLVQTGDDIIVQAGAALSSANNPTTPVDPAAPFGTGPNITLLAGNFSGPTGLTGPILTPISSIVAAGSLDANTGAVVLRGNAIDGLGGSITGASLSAEINDAPNTGLPQSNDAGLLGANCLQGNVCLGTVIATNRIEVGQNSNNDVIQLIMEQASIAANDVLITTRNDIVMGTGGLPSVIAAGNQFSAQSLTGDINLGNAAITSGQIILQAAGSLLGNGSLSSTGDVGITVGQDLNALQVDAGGQLTTAANVGGVLEASYTVPGAVAIGTLAQGAGNVNVIAGTDNSVGTVILAAPGNVTLVAGNAGAGDVFLGTAANNGTINLTGTNAGFTALTPTGSVTINAANTVTGGTIAAGGNIAIGAGGTVNAASLAAAQTGTGLVNVAATGGITLGILTGNTANLTATNGPVTVTSDVDVTGLVTASGTAVQLVSTRNLAVNATATAGGVAANTSAGLTVAGANATGAITLGAGTNVIVTGGINAGTSLDIVAGGLLDIQTLAAGTTITALSGDINIGPSGALGLAGRTSSILLESPGDMTLGGPAGSPATYELDNAEFARIASGGDITIASGGNIRLDTLDVQAGAGGNIGTGGGLFLSASGDADVVGIATVTNAAANTVLAIDALGAIRVAPATGALRVENGNGGFAGQIALTAPRIEAISDLARADIAGLSTTAINIRLGQNDGRPNDLGYFSASGLTFNASDALLIQNSGASVLFADRRGFVADNVTINTAGATSVIVINGIIGGATGIAAIGLANIPGSFDPRSTINGCLILGGATCRTNGTGDPIQDLIDEQIDPKERKDADLFTNMLVELRGDRKMGEDALLDDPVTGAGNEDLWIGDADCDTENPAEAVCDVASDSVIEPAQ